MPPDSGQKTHESHPDPEGAPGLGWRQGGPCPGSGVNLDPSAWPPGPHCGLVRWSYPKETSRQQASPSPLSRGIQLMNQVEGVNL